MKTRYFILITILTSFLVAICPLAIAQELQKEQQETLIKLKKRDPLFQIRWNKKTLTPAHLRGKLTGRMKGTSKEIAIRFFQDFRTLFKLRDVEKELSAVKVKSDDLGWQHVSLQQMYKNVPVEGKTILVHINKEKEVKSISANYLPDIDLDVAPKISKEKATKAARDHLKSKKVLLKEPTAKLFIYTRENKIYLAWKIGLVSKEPLADYDYFIDAHTGKYIYRYNKLKFDLDRKTYTANNGFSLPGTLVISEGQTSTDDVVQNAHRNMGNAYRYFKNHHQRNSWDDDQATIVTTVHYRNNWNNAGWSPTLKQFVFGDGDGIQYDPLGGAFDIVVHEFTHAITDETAGFIYERQSGALHESFSDVFASFADGDWMIGEDIFTPGTPGDASRYIDDPPSGGQPDHMNNFQDFPLVTVCDGTNDQCGVHTNSGIPNKVAYLITDGGTHNGITVAGIGVADAEKIYYSALTDYLLNTPGATFMHAREALDSAASAPEDGDLTKTIAVQNAFSAVGIGDPFSGPAITLTPLSLSVPEGSVRTLTALVTDNGVAVSGATVTLTIANTSRAIVIPTSINTGSDGRATCSIKGISKGNTILTGSTIVGAQAASDNTTVRVYRICTWGCSPALAGTNNQVAWIMLTPLFGIILWRYKLRRKKK